MTPLAREIYRQLLALVRAHEHEVTYAVLAAAVAKKQATHHRSPSFHAALGEVTTACKAQGLPALPAIVFRASAGRPGSGYYDLAHPRAKTDEARVAAWEREHAAVVAATSRFPAAL